MAFLEKRPPQVDRRRVTRTMADRCRTCVSWWRTSRRAAREVREMGGADKIAKQHARGKMTARERARGVLRRRRLLRDRACTARRWGSRPGPTASDKPPADGVVTTFGKVDGRMVCCAAYDFTVKGGSIGYTGEEKVTRLRSMALKGRWPMVLVHRLGGRAHRPGLEPPGHDLALRRHAGTCSASRCIMSGVVPQVAAMVGPGAAGTAYIPGLADYVPMVKNIGLAGARRARRS